MEYPLNNMVADSYERRILYHLSNCVGARTTWNNLKYSLETDMGTSIDPLLLHYKLEKLRNEKKIKFVIVGDFTSYQLISSY
ncbi:MAG: hypothetical protein K0S67_44 [Nitrososphaeraceae archaeon]|jgi:hypothetical protein|nr:hypothetical protein [Nitrososphaeraceae archaeon]